MLLIINGRLPNLNDYVNVCRRNPYEAANLKKKVEKQIGAQIAEQMNGVHFNNPVELTFDWYEPNKNRDMDNICFAKKFILDALVKNGVIDTDGWRGVAGFTDDFHIDRDNPRIEVRIREVKNEKAI